jgi:hypothetical protein
MKKLVKLGKFYIFSFSLVLFVRTSKNIFLKGKDKEKNDARKEREILHIKFNNRRFEDSYY